jgi:hypothetical protein
MLNVKTAVVKLRNGKSFRFEKVDNIFLAEGYLIICQKIGKKVFQLDPFNLIDIDNWKEINLKYKKK